MTLDVLDGSVVITGLILLDPVATYDAQEEKRRAKRVCDEKRHIACRSEDKTTRKWVALAMSLSSTDESLTLIYRLIILL